MILLHCRISFVSVNTFLDNLYGSERALELVHRGLFPLQIFIYTEEMPNLVKNMFRQF